MTPTTSAGMISVADLASGHLSRTDLHWSLDHPVVLVDLDTGEGLSSSDMARAAGQIIASGVAVVGVARGRVDATTRRLLDDVTLTLTGPDSALDPRQVCVADPVEAAESLVRAAEASPRATLTLVGVLRATSGLDVRDGLVLESTAYSMLLAGPEFAAWLGRRTPRPVLQPVDPVAAVRRGDVLALTLDRAERRNAFGQAVRDRLLELLEVAELDDSIGSIEIDGRGPSFCSGGDLDEFGTFDDVATAHVVRTARSVGEAVHRLEDRVSFMVHGTCVGAGIEIPAFAGWVTARRDSTFRLPELQMGLIPGAGGTVSLTRRIGRWRTAWLALAGASIDAWTAVDWGLVDEVV